MLSQAPAVATNTVGVAETSADLDTRSEFHLSTNNNATTLLNNAPPDVVQALGTVLQYLAGHASAAPAQATGTVWIDQSKSPLGRRTHIAACRRLLTAGDPRAVQRVQRYMLTQAAVDEAMRAGSATGNAPTQPAPADELARLRSRYGAL